MPGFGSSISVASLRVHKSFGHIETRMGSLKEVILPYHITVIAFCLTRCYWKGLKKNCTFESQDSHAVPQFLVQQEQQLPKDYYLNFPSTTTRNVVTKPSMPSTAHNISAIHTDVKARPSMFNYR
jgi:hypothetical protein